MRQLVALDTAGRRHSVIRSLFAQRLRLLMALNVSVGAARYRQLSGTVRKTYARHEFLSP